MLTILRRQLQLLTEDVPVSRRPVFRRSDEPDMLLATDLPLLTDAVSLHTFVLRAEQSGWCARMHRGWLLLDHPLPLWRVSHEPAGEAACVLRLLRLHPGGGQDHEAARSLAKAQQRGMDAVQQLCNALHGKYAAQLRLHQSLPDELIPVLLCAADDERSKIR